MAALPKISRLAIQDVLIVTPVRHRDDRGYFSETYSQAALAELGIDIGFVQDNQSLSRHVGVVRGLHFQLPPFAQAKILRVLRGAVFDVVVDLRRTSPTFGKSVSVTLDAESGEQIFIPAGFAHGFCTLQPDTEIFYKVSAPYARECDRGLLWSDPDLGIDWPVAPDSAVLSERDRVHPRLRDLPACFE